MEVIRTKVQWMRSRITVYVEHNLGFEVCPAFPPPCKAALHLTSIFVIASTRPLNMPAALLGMSLRDLVKLARKEGSKHSKGGKDSDKNSDKKRSK